jgi:hypothetical protein
MVVCVKDAGDRWNHFPIYCVGKAARSSGVRVSLTHGGVVAVVGHYSDDFLPRVVMQLQENLLRNADVDPPRCCLDMLTHQPRSTWTW